MKLKGRNGRIDWHCPEMDKTRKLGEKENVNRESRMEWRKEREWAREKKKEKDRPKEHHKFFWGGWLEE
jgi:hypothetical protein